MTVPVALDDLPVDAGSILDLERLHGDDVATVYLGGSVVDGFANPWSDVDVFVLTDRKPVGPFAFEPQPNAVSQHFVGDRRIDFEFWRPGYVAELAGRLAGLDLAHSRWVARGVFSFIEELFIHRLRTGVPIQSEAAFHEIRSRFDFDLFGRYLTQESVRQLDEQLADVCGMLEHGDLETALFGARSMLGTAMDAYTYRLGNTDVNAKWRLQHLKRVDDGSQRHERFVAVFWELQFPPGEALRSERERCAAYLERCIRFANEVVEWIQT